MGDDAQNRTGIGKDPSTGKFLPGNRANPGGRPKSLGRIIDEESEDGGSREIVRRQFALARGLVYEDAAEQTDSAKFGASTKVARRAVPAAVRERALEWLGDHRWGKSTQPVKLDQEPSGLESLSDADFKAALADQLAGDPEVLELALQKRRAAQGEATPPAPPAPEQQ
jgi:hypothetical protein